MPPKYHDNEEWENLYRVKEGLALGFNQHLH